MNKIKQLLKIIVNIILAPLGIMVLLLLLARYWSYKTVRYKLAYWEQQLKNRKDGKEESI